MTEATLNTNPHEHSCSCCHSTAIPIKKAAREPLPKLKLMRLGAGALLFALGFIPVLFDFRLWINIAAYLLVGADIIFSAAANLFRGKLLDENFLMAAASIGAFAIGEYPEGVAVMLFYQVGEFFQDRAVGASRRNIASLLDIRPDSANLLKDGSVLTVPPEEIAPGQYILIKPGERVPLDGIIKKGSSSMDTAALTGESRPMDVHEGDAVLSGFINLSGALEVRVTKTAGESTAAKILELVEHSGENKAPTEQFITKFARVYTPAVVLAALLLAVLPPLILMDGSWSGWIHRALVFLVVSCPCALVISIPLSFFGGIGAASRQGILFKGGNFLEALNKADTVVFDKTGTLTSGQLRVAKVESAYPWLLELAAHAEHMSTHPLGRAICREYGGEVSPSRVAELREIAGFGIACAVDGKRVLAGNRELLAREGISAAPASATAVHVAVDGAYAGYIGFEDQIRPDSADTINTLRSLGVRKTVLLTGDTREAAERLSERLPLDEVYSGLMPEGKVERVEALEKELDGKGALVYIGDGMNDAPVLARADIGVAMGGIGSDAAIEAADVVIMTDEPKKLCSAIKIARKTHRIVMQNIVLALGVKAVVMLLGALGITGIWLAVFADVGVAMLAVLNAARTLRLKDI